MSMHIINTSVITSNLIDVGVISTIFLIYIHPFLLYILIHICCLKTHKNDLYSESFKARSSNQISEICLYIIKENLNFRLYFSSLQI